ncbi:neutral permease protein [Diaporthe amygdali]|uniref:neutral permease protein n=1 Tax=Phomopsis amygdali TaxID=1214568 RepID=UPI0022FE7E3A|nr:neutral permease protein [Diaporthe amygdali]KAJ0116751.1 neutral permease protein [Diaporthe amygdali]
MTDTKVSLDEIWAEAARQFQDICGESLQRGDVKSFDDVRKKIENANKQPGYVNDESEDKWEKAKTVGLQSLKYMKMLLGAASQAAVFIPIPAAAANIAGSALSFVFDIPERIRGYNEAVDGVFTVVSSALSQFEIYESIEGIDPVMVQQIHRVMVSIVKICAHVVKYRQGRRGSRLKRQIASIFDDNKPLEAELNEFRRVLQEQRDIEGTVSLSVLVKTQSGVVTLLERSAVFGKTVEDTYQAVQSLKDNNERTQTLIKIRNTLQVPTIVLLDTRTTQTCTNLANKCLEGTGSWIWKDEAFVSWTEGTAKGDNQQKSNVLIVSGPPSSGKTLATAQIIKHLEEEKGRAYIAHYFFMPASSKKVDEDGKHVIHSALRYMAFQFARVDATVRKSLGKACESLNLSTLIRNSSSDVDGLWSELKIVAPGSGTTYYLAFDGVENLEEKEREILLDFIFSPKLAAESAGRVRVLVSGTDAVLKNEDVTRNALRIEMDRYNESDMRLFIEDRLSEKGLLRHAAPGSVQQKAKDNVLAKLPPKASGSYSQLQFALDEVVRLLSSRTSIAELDKVLNHPMNSHETAIKALQRSLTLEEISELNELLKWVHFSSRRMTVAELEGAMLLYSGTESIGLLQDIITSKYLAVLKIDCSEDGCFVEGQDGALEYLQKEEDRKGRQSKDQPTISMTININNVDHEVVGHFLWDLAQKGIRDQFRFNFDSASNILHTRQSTIAVDEYEAHHTIAMRALKYLCGEPRDETQEIGRYLFWCLPYHLGRLTQLEYDEKGGLMPEEQREIGQHLYHLFKDHEAFKRHKKIVEHFWWTAKEMKDVQKWLTTLAVVRRLPRQWREEVQQYASPVRGYLRPLVKMVIESWLRDRGRITAETLSGYRGWILQFMEVDEQSQALPQTPTMNTTGTISAAPSTSETSEVDWYRVSLWCQNFLELPSSDLDSLWWSRIGQAAVTEGWDNPQIVKSLFKRALEEENPSWISNANLAECHYRLGDIAEAIAEVELALKMTEREGSWPTAQEEDIMNLRFSLGSSHLEDGNIQQAAEQFCLVSNSSISYWAEPGQVAHIKAVLSLDDAKKAQEMLQGALATDGSERSMVPVLKMIARDQDHNFTISKMFTIANEDSNLLKGLWAALEKATTPLAPGENKATEMSKDDRFSEEVSRGVLLYHRGMAVAYGRSPEGAGSVNDALAFWHECRAQLHAIGGSVASTTRTNATAEIAKYYFHTLTTNQGPPEHIEMLSKLAREDSGTDGGDPVGYLAALYALRDEKEKSRGLLSRQIKVALQILSDDNPDNDYYGLLTLFKSLAHCRDFNNAAAALTLMGSPDLLTTSLHFESDDITDGEVSDKHEVKELVEELGKQILQAVKTLVPDSSQQSRRFELAKEHVDALVAADLHESKARATALTLLNTRISTMLETHTSTMKTMVSRTGWFCNGLGPPGTACDKEFDFDHEFYHCICCWNCDFCLDCLKKLREGPTPGMQCSAEHVWIKLPPQGSDFYRGFDAKSIRVPMVRAIEGGEMLFEACYDTDGETNELTLDAWKAALAKEWDISLEDLKDYP